MMNARQLRAMGDRCRDLLRVATRDDVREQLREWADDFEAEAEALDRVIDRSSVSGERRKEP